MKINLQVGKLKSFFVPEFITQLVVNIPNMNNNCSKLNFDLKIDKISISILMYYAILSYEITNKI